MRRWRCPTTFRNFESNVPHPHTLITRPFHDRRLTLIFEKQLDRWSHCIGWNDEGAKDLSTASIWLRSVEGNPDHNWPPSPALQEVSFHEMTAGAAVLAVGMAGKSHWSASFSVEPDQSILADLACLLRSTSAAENPQLCSSYQLDRAEVAEHHHDRVVIESDRGARLSLEWEPQQLQSHVSETAAGAQTLLLIPSHIESASGKPTRWKYRWRML